jgi:glucose-specific phosphotransferase system IIA component
VQAVFGTQAELLKNDIKDALAGPAPSSADVSAAEPMVDTPSFAPGHAASSTTVLAPLRGRAVPLQQVPDPTFAEGIVGNGAAIDPPHEILDAIAPIAGTVFQMMPHAYVILNSDGVGVLVHLGLDTVQLGGAGFTAHVQKGDKVAAGDPIITYDVPAIVAAGRNPIVPVVVMDRKPEDIVLADVITAGGPLASAQQLFTVNK